MWSVQCLASPKWRKFPVVDRRTIMSGQLFEASIYGRTVRNSPDVDFTLAGRRQELLH